jgi:hypothetical protein
MPRPCRGVRQVDTNNLAMTFTRRQSAIGCALRRERDKRPQVAARQGCQSYSQNGVMRIPVSFLVIFKTIQSHDLPALKGFQ